MKIYQNKEQYASLLKKYLVHAIKGSIVVIIFFGVVLAMFYFFFLPETIDLFNSLFVIVPVLIIGALIFVVTSIIKLIRSLQKDIAEESYETFIDRLSFIQSARTKTKYSEKLVLEQHKEVQTNLTEIQILQGEEYEFTVSKRTRLVVALRKVETVEEKEETVESRELHNSFRDSKTTHTSSKLVRLDEEELNGYRKIHVIPTLILAFMIGGFTGMIVGMLLSFVLKEYYPDKSGLLIISCMLTGTTVLFFFMFRSIIRNNDKVLANPYKRIYPVTIESVKEVKRSKRTYYHTYFNTEDSDIKFDKRLNYNQSNQLKNYTGQMYLHVEENHKVILKITTASNYPLIKFY